MRRVTVTCLSLCATALAVASLSIFGSTAAAAASELDTIVSNTESDHVYVEEGVPYATSTSEAQLSNRLSTDDGIIVIALTDESAATIANPEQFVKQLGDTYAETNDHVVVGIVIGDEGYAYSNYISPLTVDTLMTRAETVATNPTEVLGTFIQNVHSWQTANPLPDPPAPASADGFPWPPVIIGLIIGSVIGITVAVWRSMRFSEYERVHIRSVPSRLRPSVRHLIDLDDKLPFAAGSLRQIARDINYYYKGLRQRPDSSKLDSDLKRILGILDKCVEIGEDSRYFGDDGEKFLVKSARATSEFADQVRNLASGEAYRGLSKSLGDLEVLQQDSFSLD